MTTKLAVATPGPWEVGPLAGREDGNGNDERVIQLYDGGPVIASAWPMGEDFNKEDAPERDANARLLAAAWEMHELLQWAHDRLVEAEELRGWPGTEPDWTKRNEIRTLLARINGEG